MRKHLYSSVSGKNRSIPAGGRRFSLLRHISEIEGDPHSESWISTIIVRPIKWDTLNFQNYDLVKMAQNPYTSHHFRGSQICILSCSISFQGAVDL